MVNTSRVVRLAAVALFLSLLDGRSAQAPPEPVTRFRAVEGYSLFITVESDDDMKVEFQRELLQRKYKETFTARIDLTERHLDNDYVEWTGEGVAEQVLEEKRKEVHGLFVQESEATGQGTSKTKVTLNIDELQQTFQVWVDAEYIPAAISGFKKDPPKPTDQFSSQTSLSTTGLRWVPELHPLPASGLALNADGPYPMEQCGTYCENFDWAHSHFEHAHKGRVKIELVPLGASEPKLILTPPDDYSTWRPRPPQRMTSQPQPQPASVNVASRNREIFSPNFLLQILYPKFLPLALQSAGERQLQVDLGQVQHDISPFDVRWEIVPEDTPVLKVVFQLTDVSHYPGECMNWPLAPENPPEPDLEFVPLPHYGNHILKRPFQTLTLLDVSLPSASAQGLKGKVRMRSKDGAAVGVLFATAELAGKPPLHGIIRGQQNSNRLLIPDHEETKSDIAKAWRKDKKVTEIEYFKDGDDNENDPKGDGQVGDGLTVWEEYRGFRQGGQWQDNCDPRKKDLFIENKVGADAAAGIDLFRKITGLFVHDRLVESERKSSRVINFNARDGFPHIEQHCLVLRPSDNPLLGTAEGELFTLFPGPPKNTEWVNVVMSRDLDFEMTIVGEGSTRNHQSEHIAHELCHAIGIYHHGEADPWMIFPRLPGVRWTRDGGNSLVRRGTDVGAAEYGQQILEGLTPIKVLHERGLRPMSAEEVFGSATATERVVYLGRRSGQHSGNTDCVMRYTVAQAYENSSDPAGRIWHGGGELPGNILCDSPAGTRFNYITNEPQSRYGPAAEKRGNCIHQFVISDKWDRQRR